MPEHTLWALVNGEKKLLMILAFFDRRRPNPQVQEKLLRKATKKGAARASIMAKRQIENWAKGLPRNPSRLWQANCEGPIISLDLGGTAWEEGLALLPKNSPPRGMKIKVGNKKSFSYFSQSIWGCSNIREAV